MLLSGWAWHVICAPDIFSWNFSFLLLNIGQLVYIVYQMRPIKFDPELEEVYHTLFYPFKVNFLQYCCKFVNMIHFFKASWNQFFLNTGFTTAIQTISIARICNDNVSSCRRGVRDAKSNENR